MIVGQISNTTDPIVNALSPNHYDSGVLRRDVLCGGGAGLLGYIVAALLEGAKPARAEALRGPVPEVDRLAVRVVTDSYQLAIAPNMTVGQVEVQRFGMPPAGKSLLGEFGLAIHLESGRGNETRNIFSTLDSHPKHSTTTFTCSGSAPKASMR